MLYVVDNCSLVCCIGMLCDVCVSMFADGHVALPGVNRRLVRLMPGGGA